MIFQQTKLRGAYIIELKLIEDHRGFFARAWCKDEFTQHGLNVDVVQSNVGFSKAKGTLRGMHYQIAPYEETKLVRCTMGSIYDVIIDLRPDSPTYKQWVGVELTATNYKMIYLPEGFAHGYQTLTDHSETFYQTSQFYSPEASRGVRYDDPAFGIEWPMETRIISAADNGWPDYSL